MDGFRIRFPGTALMEKINIKDDSQLYLDNTFQDLSSFNLSLGDLGQARLVTRVVKEHPGSPETCKIVPNCYQGKPIKIGVSQLVLDGEGQQVGKVKVMISCKILF